MGIWLTIGSRSRGRTRRIERRRTCANVGAPARSSADEAEELHLLAERGDFGLVRGVGGARDLVDRRGDLGDARRGGRSSRAPPSARSLSPETSPCRAGARRSSTSSTADVRSALAGPATLSIAVSGAAIRACVSAIGGGATVASGPAQATRSATATSGSIRVGIRSGEFGIDEVRV